MKKVTHILMIFCLLGQPVLSAPTMETFDLDALDEISKNIEIIQPTISESRRHEYSIAILRASTRYKIKPNILISIVNQESSFRENLPEGKAGEIGIAQIRKAWLKNPKFKKEFKNAKVSDLKNTARNILMAAWILKDLKEQTRKKENIPFWTYYNARAYSPRLRYFVRVQRHLMALEMGTTEEAEIERRLASRSRENWRPENLYRSSKINYRPRSWISNAINALQPARREGGAQLMQATIGLPQGTTAILE